MDKVFKITGVVLGTAAAGVGAYFGKKAYDKKKKSKANKAEEAATVAETTTEEVVEETATNN